MTRTVITKHGRDHLADGADPIGGGAIAFDTVPQAGDWVWIETTGAGPNPGGTFGTGLGVSAIDGGVWFSSTGASNPGFHVDTQDAGNSGIELSTYDSSQGIRLTTNGSTSPGIELATVGGSSGILLRTFAVGSNVADITLLQGTDGQIVIQNSGAGTSGITISNGAGGGLNLVDTADGVNVQTDGGGKLGFFGVTAVVQQATPTTIAEIVDLLQAYGLSA